MTKYFFLFRFVAHGEVPGRDGLEFAVNFPNISQAVRR